MKLRGGRIEETSGSTRSSASIRMAFPSRALVRRRSSAACGWRRRLHRLVRRRVWTSTSSRRLVRAGSSKYLPGAWPAMRHRMWEPVPATGYSSGGFARVADLDANGTAELVLSTDSPAEPIVGVMSYPSGQVLALFRPLPGGNVRGAHVAVGRIAGAGQPYLFVTAAEGAGTTTDVYRFVGGTFSLVTRVPVVEVS